MQRRATKLISDLQDRTYDDRLAVLDLPSLKYCRQCGDMIMTYQLLHHNLDIDISELFILNLSITRGHNFKLFKPHSSSRVRSSFFTMRVINDWNNLPHHVVNASSLNDFKNLLDCSWSTLMYDY